MKPNKESFFVFWCVTLGVAYIGLADIAAMLGTLTKYSFAIY